MKLTIWELGRENLERIEEPQRSFIIGLSLIANETSFLQKLLYWISLADDELDIHRRASATQSLIVAKILAGKLFEAWRFLEKSYFSSVFSRDHENELNEDGKQAIKELRDYFGKSSNVLSTVRNDFAFHYNLESLKAGFSLSVNDEAWHLYLSAASGNNLYYMAELVSSYSMFTDIDKADYSEGMDRLLKDIVKITRAFSIFCESSWVVVADKYLKESTSVYRDVEVFGLPHLIDVRIPFFVEVETKHDTRD